MQHPQISAGLSCLTRHDCPTEFCGVPSLLANRSATHHAGRTVAVSVPLARSTAPPVRLAKTAVTVLAALT